MKLYEIANEIRVLFELEDESGEIPNEVFDRLANLNLAMDAKVDAICGLVKELQADSDAAKAEAAGGTVIEEFGDYCRITFAEKPSRLILNELKVSGFHWGGGSWSGRTANIPNSVRATTKPGAS